ncbi:MAG TPA: TraR/DksA C4-type zinc finger protein [Pirellulaceae bacterium]|nr:TraR/DksA C4-type zinc finger protein [Pirellulaceae bacterium]HMO90782.1 TraR/DksA C4-type zinc finger protein [Pirellulaceae bacterium]HMP68033.1 TraR/DksA C4-type zinc finger protein [Pirellulaceae bacterium]
MARKDSLKKLKAVLATRRKALRMALDGDTSLLREIQHESSGDVADYALDSSHDEISSQLAELASRELMQIEVALERHESGTYGNCQGCDTNIPLARLEALPYAPYCIQCQRLSEQQGGLPITESSFEDLRINDLNIS